MQLAKGRRSKLSIRSERTKAKFLATTDYGITSPQEIYKTLTFAYSSKNLRSIVPWLVSVMDYLSGVHSVTVSLVTRHGPDGKFRLVGRRLDAGQHFRYLWSVAST